MKILLTLFLVLSMAAFANASDVTFVWDASTSPEVIGYRVRYSTNMDLSNPTTVDVGPSLGVKLTLVETSSYYVWVVAYAKVTPGATSGPEVESMNSNVVRIYLNAPSAPQNFRIQSTQ